ncbi:hypothetical protein, partial [Streptomyces sp. NPDC000931]|uniref:hypothetical protein n=1 Tax=Streptomyces sp. NPDC000931 TaxID=3154372 RepID=UPI003327A76A
RLPDPFPLHAYKTGPSPAGPGPETEIFSSLLDGIALSDRHGVIIVDVRLHDKPFRYAAPIDSQESSPLSRAAATTAPTSPEQPSRT